MEKKIRTKTIEVDEECFVAADGTEFETEDQCLEYEKTLSKRVQKDPRINMAFYGDNLDYVREAAHQNRMSITEYVNKLIIDDKECFVLEDGTEFETEEACLSHENKLYRKDIKRETKSKRINLLIRPSDYEKLVAVAEAEEVSLNELINRLVKNNLK